MLCFSTAALSAADTPYFPCKKALVFPARMTHKQLTASLEKAGIPIPHSLEIYIPENRSEVKAILVKTNYKRDEDFPQEEDPLDQDAIAADHTRALGIAASAVTTCPLSLPLGMTPPSELHVVDGILVEIERDPSHPGLHLFSFLQSLPEHASDQDEQQDQSPPPSPTK